MLSAKNRVEIDFKSVEGLNMIISRLDRPIMGMIDRCGHPDEKPVVKLCSYTTCGNAQKAMCVTELLTSNMLIWPRNYDSASSAFPSYICGVHHLGWDFFVCDRFFNPTTEVVTFCLCGWCTD